MEKGKMEKGKMEIGEAITMLITEYERWKKVDWKHDPLKVALISVLDEASERNKRD